MLDLKKSILLLFAVICICDHVFCDRKTDMKKILLEYNTAIMKEWKKVDKECRDQSGFNFTVDNSLSLVEQVKKGSESAICFGECALIEFGVIDVESDLNPTNLLKKIPNNWRNGEFGEKINILMDKCDMKPTNDGETCSLGAATIKCITTLSDIIENMPISSITKLFQEILSAAKN